jgi:hypothetical protein
MKEEIEDTKGVKDNTMAKRNRIEGKKKTLTIEAHITPGFVTRLTRRIPQVEYELVTLPEHLRSPTVFSGVRVTRSLVLCVCFVERFFFSFYSISFGHCVVFYPFSIFNFLLNVTCSRHDIVKELLCWS